MIQNDLWFLISRFPFYIFGKTIIKGNSTSLLTFLSRNDPFPIEARGTRLNLLFTLFHLFTLFFCFLRDYWNFFFRLCCKGRHLQNRCDHLFLVHKVQIRSILLYNFMRTFWSFLLKKTLNKSLCDADIKYVLSFLLVEIRDHVVQVKEASLSLSV